VIVIDWSKCTNVLHEIAASPISGASIARLIDGCRVCGDWTPLLDWNRRHEDGGPTREAIADAMNRCGYCSASGKQYFLGTLDDARGTNSRKPWRVYADECKAAASAVPDSRFASAPYYALDRIGRLATAHGSKLATLVAALDVPLPAVSLTGVGVELPAIAGAAGDPIGTTPIVTVLGDQLLVATLPRGKLGEKGVVVDLGRAAYPGTPIDRAKKPWFADVPKVAVLAAKQAPAGALVDIVAEAAPTKTEVHLAIDSGGLAQWSIPAIAPIVLEAGNDITIDDAMTVQDFATAIGKLGKPRVGIARRKK
jgi:hypothetical protein